MKNLLQTAKTGLFALLPFLLSCKLSVASGGSVSLDSPPLATVLTSLPALASTALTWYELFVRLVPTSRNYSLISFAGQLIQSLVPNRAADNADPAITQPRFSGGRLAEHFN